MKIKDIKLTPILDTLRLEDISDEVYFSKKYSDYISNSRLGLINPEQNGSPEKYFGGFSNNKIYSDSLIFGSAVHELSLQPEDFFLCETIDRPTGKPGHIADVLYETIKKKKKSNFDDSDLIHAAAEVDYYHGLLSQDKLKDLRDKVTGYIRNRLLFESSHKDSTTPIYLDPKNREKLSLCMDALNSNNKIQSLLHPKDLFGNPLPSENEKTILLDLEVEVPGEDKFILKLKSKLDNYTIDELNNKITINDVKTTGRPAIEFDKVAIDKYHYFREMAMYSYLLILCSEKFYGLKEPSVRSNFLVVSTIPNYNTRVCTMNKGLFMKGFNEFKNLVKLVAYYTIYGSTAKASDLRDLN